MDVTNKNFESLFPVIEEEIERCAFIAIDTELSGLKIADGNYNYFETVEERYKKEKESASEFLVLQFGLVPFFYDAEKDAYTHKAYNFYTFPRQAGPNGANLRFLCESSSIEFLCEFGFDFNKLFYDGIAHLTFSQEKKMRDDVERRRKEAMVDENSINNAISVPEHMKKFMSETESTIKRFVASKKTEYMFGILTPYQRKLIFSNLKPKFGNKLYFETVHDQDSESAESSCVSESDSEASGSKVTKLVELEEKIWTGGRKPEVKKKKINNNSRDKCLRIKKVSMEELNRLQDEKERKELDIIENAIGFSKVIRKISQSKKIVVGHNMLLDVAHTISQFIDPLPENLAEFKEVVQTAFHSIVDTKLMASTHPFREQITSTVLFDLYTRLHEEPYSFPEVRKVSEDSPAGYDFLDNKKHEAGYDAYITGICFVAMCQYLGELHTPKKSRVLPDSPLVMPFLNKIYMMRMLDITYLNISGTDLTPSRSHVFHVECPRETVSKNIHDMFSPFGQVQVHWQNSTSLFVSLNDKDQAPLIMRNIECKSGFKVEPFEQYQKSSIEKKRPLTGESPERSQDSSAKPVISNNISIEANKSSSPPNGGQKKKRPKTDGSSENKKPVTAPFIFDQPDWD